MQKSLKTAIVIIGSLSFGGSSWALSTPNITRLAAQDAETSAVSMPSAPASVSDAERRGLPNALIGQSAARENERGARGESLSAEQPAGEKPAQIELSVLYYATPAKGFPTPKARALHLALENGRSQKVTVSPQGMRVRALGITGDLQNSDSLSFMGVAKMDKKIVELNLGAIRRTVSLSTFVAFNHESNEPADNDNADTGGDTSAPADASSDAEINDDSHSNPDAFGNAHGGDDDNARSRSARPTSREPIADQGDAQSQTAMSTIVLPNIAEQVCVERAAFRVGDSKAFHTVAGLVVVKLDSIGAE